MNMSTLFRGLLVVLITAVFVTPSLVWGAEGLITCDGVASKGVECNFCTLAQMVEKVIDFIVIILVLISVIMLAVTGIQMAYTAAGNGNALEVLKERMTNIVIGFFLILAAWTLVDTLVKVLVANTSDNEVVLSWRTFGMSTSDLCGKTLKPVEKVLYSPDYEASLTPEAAAAAAEVNPAGVSIVPDLENLASLREAGVVVADWHGIDGPGRTDKAHPSVVSAAVRMNEAAIAEFGKPIFQITAATTDGVGHSANSQHYKGTAIDLDPINGATTAQVKALAKSAGCTFILDHGSHVHCDFR